MKQIYLKVSILILVFLGCINTFCFGLSTYDSYSVEGSGSTREMFLSGMNRFNHISFRVILFLWYVLAFGFLIFLLCSLVSRFIKKHHFLSRAKSFLSKLIYDVLLANVVVFILNMISFFIVLSFTINIILGAALGGTLMIILMLCSLLFRHEKKDKLAFIFLLVDVFVIEQLYCMQFAIF